MDTATRFKYSIHDLYVLVSDKLWSKNLRLALDFVIFVMDILINLDYLMIIKSNNYVSSVFFF
jgi:hypothetical protein